MSNAIPTVPTPPMSPRVREFLYGLLAWGAALVTLATLAFAALPAATVPAGLLVASVVLNAAWTVLGFKAKSNVDYNAD